jgi:hypothetical protein
MLGCFTEGAGSAGPSFNAWHGKITGTLTLDGSGSTRFNGTATIVAEIQGRTGACHGRVTMEGTVSATSSRLEGPNASRYRVRSLWNGCTSFRIVIPR